MYIVVTFRPGFRHAAGSRLHVRSTLFRRSLSMVLLKVHFWQ